MQPYTYHLYHKPTKKHYYGVSYRKECSPSELWTSYFSSSSVVHHLIEQYGKESFIPTVRKTFESSDKAVAWETKFLMKVNAQNNDLWLNRHNGKAKFMGPHSHSDESKSKISKKHKGTLKSEETKQKMRARAKEREEARRAAGWTMPIEAINKANDTRQKRILIGEINPYSSERNSKISDSKKGTKRQYLPDGSYVMVKI